MKHVEIYRQRDQYAGWPANYGLWIWGSEVLTLFIQGHLGEQESLHARDMEQPFVPRQARSLDGGLTWSIEPFAGQIPGGPVLSGDEHVVPRLQCGENLSIDRDFRRLEQPIDFLDPETLVLCARTGLHAGAVSWFYVSRSRGRSWEGPFLIPDFGLPGISARTDIVPLSSDEALFFLTAAKANGREGHVFCARTRDGGRTFAFETWLGDEPEGFAIMPASLRLSDGTILSAVRTRSGGQRHEWRNWIDLYRSTDDGRSFDLIGRPVENTGYGGNPPTLTRLTDGRIVLVYGFRDAPFGIRARVSADDGITWGPDIVLRDDGGMSDLGYPRTILRPDGTLLTVYYYNDPAVAERYIAGTLFSAE